MNKQKPHVGSDIEVDDATAVEREDHEHIEVSEQDCRHRQEIDGDGLVQMVPDEGLPILGRPTPPFDHVAGHGRFAHPIAKLHQLAMNTRSSPSRVLTGNPFDQFDYLLGNAWATDLFCPAFEPPPQPPTLAVPGDDGFGFDQGQRATPEFPFPVKHDPESLVQGGKGGFGIRSAQNDDLLTQGEILDQEVSPGTEKVPQ